MAAPTELPQITFPCVEALPHEEPGSCSPNPSSCASRRHLAAIPAGHRTADPPRTKMCCVTPPSPILHSIAVSCTHVSIHHFTTHQFSTTAAPASAASFPSSDGTEVPLLRFGSAGSTIRDGLGTSSGSCWKLGSGREWCATFAGASTATSSPLQPHPHLLQVVVRTTCANMGADGAAKFKSTVVNTDMAEDMQKDAVECALAVR